MMSGRKRTRGATWWSVGEDDDESEEKKDIKEVPTKMPTIAFVDSPLETHSLYFTKIAGLPGRFNEYAYNLDELLGHIKPVSSVHFNFMVDTQWLIRQYPYRCRNTPMTIVVGDKQGTTSTEITNDAEKEGWTNINVYSASLPIPFGTHHSKLSIFEDDDMTLHIIVSTANLLQYDWEGKTQMFYYMKSTKKLQSERFPRRVEKGIPIVMDLIEYLRRYPFGGLTYWADRLGETEFEYTVNRIVFSVPGYHKGNAMNSVGHKSVRSILKNERDSSQNTEKALVCQASSIGSLGPQPSKWLGGEFTVSMRGGGEHDISSNTQCLMVVYPTSNDVEGSADGKRGGQSLLYAEKTSDKQKWLLNNMCRWRSENWGRSRIMPHVKTYAQVDLSTRRFDWQIVTSANLSKAAWGELQKNGQQLMIRSYEIGVLVMDPHGIRVPFDYPLCRYTDGDRPWHGD